MSKSNDGIIGEIYFGVVVINALTLLIAFFTEAYELYEICRQINTHLLILGLGLLLGKRINRKNS